MQPQKKPRLPEGLIQAALLLSLCGLKLDVGLEPGPESLLQGPTHTHLHNLRNALERDPAAKHPDLDSFFTSRRLLGWVRSLDRLQVPQAELETWLVQQDPSPLPVRLLHTDPNRLILPEEPRGPVWSQEPRGQTWEEQDIHTQVYREHVDSEQDMSPAETEDWGQEEPEDQAPAPDQQSSEGAALEECLHLLQSFPFTQDQELVCSSGSTLLPHSAPTDMEEQWQDLLDLMEPQADVEMEPPGEPLRPLLDQFCEQGAELLPLVPSDQLEAPPSPHTQRPPLLLGDLSGGLDQLLGDEDMLEHMDLLGLLEEEGEGGFGEELRSRLEEGGYLQPELSLSLCGTSTAPDEGELDSDSGLSLDSGRTPPSPGDSDSSCYSSSSSSSNDRAASTELNIKEEPLDEELGAVGGYQDQDQYLDQDQYQDQESKLFSLLSHDHTYHNQPPTLSPKMLPPRPDRASPRPDRTSPRHDRASPKHDRASPKHDRASPKHDRASPKHDRASPKHDRASHSPHSPYQTPSRIRDRDERRAKALKIPFSNDLIVHLPVEEFNDLLAGYDLSEDQLNLVREVRRRGKNKIAAQNCRQRKVRTLQGLERDVSALRKRRWRLLREKQEALREMQEVKQRLSGLYQDVFSRLRDEEGRALDVQEFVLSFEADGSVKVVSRRPSGRRTRKHTDKE